MMKRLARPILALEAAALGGAYFVFHRMNTSHEFREKAPSWLVAGFSTATGWKPDDDVPLRKQDMRKSMKKRLKSIEDIDTQSNAVLTKLSSILKDYENISVYINMPERELRTYPDVLNYLFENDKMVFVPKVTGPKSEEMLMIRVDSLQDIQDSFHANAWGILEPQNVSDREDACESGRVDLVIVPGVAFDEKCQRLGHGRGYYDSFLTRLNRKRESLSMPPAKTIGVALREQLLVNDQEIPVNENDICLDAIVTPDRVIWRQ
eukprot:g6861.t1